MTDILFNAEAIDQNTLANDFFERIPQATYNILLLEKSARQIKKKSYHLQQNSQPRKITAADMMLSFIKTAEANGLNISAADSTITKSFLRAVYLKYGLDLKPYEGQQISQVARLLAEKNKRQYCMVHHKPQTKILAR